MHIAKDGKAFGNMEMGKHYDSTRPEKKAPADEGHESGAEPDIKEVVAEHGPAEHMEIHSTHADGHVHKSKHDDHESAARHVAHAFGEETPEHEAGESEEFEAGEHEGMEEAIPTMRG